MAGSMSSADLVSDLKRSLHDAASVFNAADDADFLRLLGLAAVAMQSKGPRTLLGTVTLTADEQQYPLALANFAQYKTHAWAGRPVLPWDPCYPGALPRVSAAQEGAQWALVFDPAPSGKHIAAYGSTFRFWYFAAHAIGATAAETTLALPDRSLLLLRAQAEAMRELSMRNINKPVQVRDGFSGTPRNSTPAALYVALLEEWERAT